MEREPDSENKVILPTTDLRRSYTLEAVRTLFIFCSDPVDKFAERYKLSPTLVEAYVREGRWDELRAAHTEKALEVLRTAVTGQVEDSLDVEIKLQSLRNIQSEQQIQELARYYEKYGDLWARNPANEQVMRDAFGFPMPLRIPQSLKAAHELIAGLQARLSELVKEQKALEESRPVNGKAIIEVSDYKHLLKKKEKESSGT